jgi:hypothetical protein
MIQDKNRVVAPPVTPKGRGGGFVPKFNDLLKILRFCNLNSKVNLKIKVGFKMFSQ